MDNKFLIKVIKNIKSGINLFQPQFLFRDFTEYDVVNEAFNAILQFLKTQRFDAARSLFEEKKELIKRHDPQLFDDLNVVLQRPELKEERELEKLHEKVWQAMNNNDYKRVVEITKDLPSPEMFLTNKNSFLIWRDRATALRNTNNHREALECYLVALTLTYIDPMGPILRNNIMGQICFTYERLGEYQLELDNW